MREEDLNGERPLQLEATAVKTGFASMAVGGTWDKSAFVIESVPTRIEANCLKTDLIDIKPVKCKGQIKLRKLRPGE